MDVCCTLVSGSYFIGAAALVNSLIAHGFQGEVHIGYQGEIPIWWPADSESEVAPGVHLINIEVKTSRFLGYEKPFFMLSVAKNRLGCSRLCWLDADVVLTAPWSFVQNWVDAGIAVCADVVFPEICPLHPWRAGWRRLISQTELKEANSQQRLYANGGFIGCSSDLLTFLQIWTSLVIAFEEQGGDVSRYIMTERWRAVVSDQDLLAAALMCWDGALVPLGAEGMGFKGLSLPLSHGIESPKPWQVGALSGAASGAPITLYRRCFERYVAMGPLKPFSEKDLKLRRLDCLAATSLSRFYKR